MVLHDDDLKRNTALQHCCDVVSYGHNIVPTLQRWVVLKIVVANRPPPPPARKKFLRKEQPRGTGGSCRSQAFHHYELWLSEAKNRNILQGKITTSGFQESVS